MKQKKYDPNFFLEYLKGKIEILEIGPFRKLAIFFSIKDINLIFHTDFLDIKA